MIQRRQTKLVHAGGYAAEVDITLIEDETGWRPYLSLEDARKLDRVRAALKAGEVKVAAEDGRVFRLTPVETT